MRKVVGLFVAVIALVVSGGCSGGDDGAALDRDRVEAEVPAEGDGGSSSTAVSDDLEVVELNDAEGASFKCPGVEELNAATGFEWRLVFSGDEGNCAFAIGEGSGPLDADRFLDFTMNSQSPQDLLDARWSEWQPSDSPPGSATAFNPELMDGTGLQHAVPYDDPPARAVVVRVTVRGEVPEAELAAIAEAAAQFVS